MGMFAVWDGMIPYFTHHHALEEKAQISDKQRRNATTMKEDLNPDQLCEWITKTIDATGLLQTEYVQIVDFDTLMPISEFDGHHAIACIAVWAGKVRLIDNIEF